MRYKSISVNKRISDFILSLKESWRLVLLVSVFICGLIIGAFAVKNNDSLLSSQLEEIIKTSIIKKNDLTFLKSFIDSLISDLMFLIITFSLGLCAIGIPAISVIPLIKGFSLGITGAYIYLNYSVKGVCYCLLVLFPAQIISAAILIFACNESFYMSADLFSTINNKSIIKDKNLVRLYLTRFGLLSILMILTSLFDALLSKLFSSIFSFI